MRARIEHVLDVARVEGLRQGENPERWKGHLQLLLGRQAKERAHLSAMAYEDVPAFVQRLRLRRANAARALEFTILGATRTTETIQARWSEIEGDLWVIPGERMKSGREHIVTLTPRMLEILPAGTTAATVELASGDFRFFRLRGRSTTVKRVYTCRIGQAGRKLSDYISVTGAFSAKALIAAVPPKLVVFDHWINESAAAQGETAYNAAYQDGINAAKAAGSDVLLFGGHFVNGDPNRGQYMTWLSDLATLNAVLFLGLATTAPEWASYAAANAAGYMNTDAIHLRQAGAAAKGQAIYNRIGVSA